MKISQETLTLLKNFAGINGNLAVKTGSVVSTVSAGKNIVSLATITESFPRDFSIYDLNSLLGLLTLMEDQEVEFGETSIRISKDGNEFEYYYSDPSVVTASPYKALEIDPVFEFTLTAADITMIQRAASIVSAPTVSIVSDGTSVSLKVGDPANAASNSYRKSMTVDGDAPVFDARLRVENLKVITDDYTVAIGKKKALHFKSKSRDLEYWLAMEPSSVV